MLCELPLRSAYIRHRTRRVRCRMRFVAGERNVSYGILLSEGCVLHFRFWRAVRRRRQECDSSPPRGGGGELRDSKESQASLMGKFSGSSLRPARLCESQYLHASASPAAEAISDKGRPRRRSVKNRKSFDCFKSAVRHPIQRSHKDAPEIVSPRRFFGYLLSAQKVTYEK